MIKQFIEKVQQQELSVNSIIVTQDNKTESYFFHEDSLTSIRSISKVLSCLGVYHAIKSGIFDLDTKVLHFFPDIRINENRQKLENLTIEDLLTLRMGHKKGLLFSKDVAQLPQGTDLLEYIFNFEIPNNPGEFFIYNNANTYILSSIVQRETRMNFSDWVKTKVFAPLNIEDYLWENSAQGICLGASGLWLKNKDLHKVEDLKENFKKINNVEWMQKCDQLVWEIKLKTEGYNDNIKNQIRTLINSKTIVSNRFLKVVNLYLDYQIKRVYLFSFAEKRSAISLMDDIQNEIKKIVEVADNFASQSEDVSSVNLYQNKKAKLRGLIRSKNKLINKNLIVDNFKVNK